MKTIVSVGIALLIAAPVAAGEEVVDEFRGAEFEGRQAERDDWQFQDGIASCVADPDLYKQFKNHAPILKWPREFSDATIKRVTGSN